MSVNVYTEWGDLKEVIVGSCINHTSMNVDISFQYFFHDNIRDQVLKNSVSLQKRLIDQRSEDLDELANLLKSMGIKTHRPRDLKNFQGFETPNFKDTLSPVDNPRDQVLIVGDEIIETPCIWRRRYFENDLMKDIFMEYFKEGAKWTSAPRPEMKDASFDLSNLNRESTPIDWGYYDSLEKNFEIMFDGAQCLKFGEDIVMNVANENHRLGFKWLQRHLEGRFNLHAVQLTDHHIDGMFMPLRPGKLLINSTTMDSKIEKLPGALQSWDMIRVPVPHKENNEGGGIALASGNINVNVLPINQTQIIIFGPTVDSCEPLRKTLETHDFEAIPIQLRHSRLFGGGAHCATLDTVRIDKKESFFS